MAIAIVNVEISPGITCKAPIYSRLSDVIYKKEKKERKHEKEKKIVLSQIQTLPLVQKWICFKNVSNISKRNDDT